MWKTILLITLVIGSATAADYGNINLGKEKDLIFKEGSPGNAEMNWGNIHNATLTNTMYLNTTAIYADPGDSVDMYGDLDFGSGAGIEMDSANPGNIEMWGGNVNNATYVNTTYLNTPRLSTFVYVDGTDIIAIGKDGEIIAQGTYNTDDDAVLTAAINNGNGTVFIGPGNYTNISITSTYRVRIIGQGSKEAVTLNKLTNFTCIRLAGYGSTIENIRILGERDSSGYCIELSAPWSKCYNCYTDGGYIGIRPSIETWIVDTTIAHPVNAGILIDDWNDHKIINCRILGSGANTTNGILITKSRGTWIDNCDVTSCQYAMTIKPTDPDDVMHLFVTNSAFDSSAKSNLLLWGTGDIVGLWFTGCWFASAAEYGIDGLAYTGSNMQEIYFNGCRIRNNGWHGVYINRGSNIHFNDCYFTDNNRLDKETAQADLVMYSDRWTVHDCVFTAGAHGHQDYAIICKTDNSSIMNNDMLDVGEIGKIRIDSFTGGQMDHNLGYAP